MEKWKRGEGADVTDMFADAPLVQNATLYWAKGPLAFLAELRRMRKLDTRDLLRSDFGERERLFCARSRVHDLCEIVVLKVEQDIDISGIASGILKALREGEFGPRTPAQEAYLKGALYEGQMHDPIPAELREGSGRAYTLHPEIKPKP